MVELWGLIKDEAETIEMYFKFLESDFAKSDDGKLVADLVEKIIAVKLDHEAALKAAYRKFGKIKPAMGTQQEFGALAAKYDEARRIIK